MFVGIRLKTECSHEDWDRPPELAPGDAESVCPSKKSLGSAEDDPSR